MLPPPPRLLLFDPYHGGHHASYIAPLFEGWHALGIPGTLTAAISPRLFDDHPDLRALVRKTPIGQTMFVEMPEAKRWSHPNLLRKGLVNRRLLRRYVERLRPEDVLHMYMDHGQFAFATGIRFSYPVRVAGLFLRVSHQHLAQAPTDLLARAHRLRKRLLLQAALRSPYIGTILSADPSVAPAVRALDAKVRTATLPDPVPLPDRPSDPAFTRAAYGVEPGRKLLLLFGALAERKGVLKTIEALYHLPDSACSALCVLFAGPVDRDLSAPLQEAIATARARRPIQLLLHDEYFHDPKTEALMEAADLVLVPYQDHPGTSSVLIRAAGARRPVLSQNYGLMAEQVRTHRLGRVVDATQPKAIADAVMAFLDDPLFGFDPDRARAFAAAHTPEAYARSVFRALGLLGDAGQAP